MDQLTEMGGMILSALLEFGSIGLAKNVGNMWKKLDLRYRSFKTCFVAIEAKLVMNTIKTW